MATDSERTDSVVRAAYGALLGSVIFGGWSVAGGALSGALGAMLGRLLGTEFPLPFGALATSGFTIAICSRMLGRRKVALTWWPIGSLVVAAIARNTPVAPPPNDQFRKVQPQGSQRVLGLGGGVMGSDKGWRRQMELPSNSAPADQKPDVY